MSDEQAMLVDASNRFMESAAPLAAVRGRADGTSDLDNADAAYRAAAAELGWFGLLADEGSGGGSVSGNGLADAAIIASERGARLQPGAFPGHSTVVAALTAAPAPAQKCVLSDLVAGEAWATWAYGSETTCSLASDATGTLRLEGRVSPIAELEACSWALIAARGPGGATQVLVDLRQPGVEVRRLEGLDVSRHWSALRLDGVEVAPDAVVGEPGASTESALARQGQLAGVLTAAESVGAIHSDLAQAVQYAKDRIAFGRPIGSFQAVKHLLADTSLWLEMSKGAVAAAAKALGRDGEAGPQRAHAAKAFVAERGSEAAHACFQVFGGIGYTWEHDQHLYLRRLAADALGFGSADWHRERLLVEAKVGQ